MARAGGFVYAGAMTRHRHSLRITRRQAAGLLGASLGAGAAAGMAGALVRATPHDLEGDLRRALAGLTLPDPDARLLLLRLEQAWSGAGLRLEAVVEMHWRPGMQRRCFAAAGADAAQALPRLVGAVRTGFLAAFR